MTIFKDLNKIPKKILGQKNNLFKIVKKNFSTFFLSGTAQKDQNIFPLKRG